MAIRVAPGESPHGNSAGAIVLKHGTRFLRLNQDGTKLVSGYRMGFIYLYNWMIYRSNEMNKIISSCFIDWTSNALNQEHRYNEKYTLPLLVLKPECPGRVKSIPCCWCPGSSSRQGISSNNIDYIWYIGTCHPLGSISITSILLLKNDTN